MMLVSCATVAPLSVLTWVLPVESIRRLATFLRLESPIISLLQEWGRRRAGVESRQGRLLWLAGHRQEMGEMGVAALRAWQAHPTWDETGRRIREFLLEVA